jgi:hypothetical protein
MKSTGIPKLARETATLASAPPNVALRLVLCPNRRYPGVARRNITSPNVITLMIDLFQF